eukprot:11211646-Lingulodinium_polyedra.AAC.1
MRKWESERPENSCPSAKTDSGTIGASPSAEADPGAGGSPGPPSPAEAAGGRTGQIDQRID